MEIGHLARPGQGERLEPHAHVLCAKRSAGRVLAPAGAHRILMAA